MQIPSAPLRSLRVAALASALALPALGFAGAALAQDNPATPIGTPVQADQDTKSFPAQIINGSCDQPGEKAYDLSAVGIPQGGQVVAAPAIPAYVGSTSIQGVGIDQLADGKHAITIAQTGGNADAMKNQMVACGLIGGTRYGNELLFTVPPVGDPLYGAVVHMVEENGGVTVHVYLSISQSGGQPATPVAQ